MPNGNDIGPSSMVQSPAMREVERIPYDLSHWSMKTGAIGSLQTLSVLPIVAGDSISLDASIVFRLSPLRRNLYLDCMVDLFCFNVPHRHVYGQNWIDFIKGGVDEAITLGSDAITATEILQCVGYNAYGVNVVPRWLTRGYIQIWNRYFRDPSDSVGLLADNHFTTLSAGDPIFKYGLKCAHLKRMFNCAVPGTLTNADVSLPLSGGEVDLRQLAALKGQMRSETARDWFSTRYQDLLKNTFDSTVNIDADQRPELVMRSRQWLSGFDVMGSDDATLGTYSGVAHGTAQLRIPSRFFSEHGTLWIMALLRFPPIVVNEGNYLVSKAEPTYAQIAGDPSVIRRSAPVALSYSDIVSGGSAIALGNTPHSQWYREQPSLCHNDYLVSAGHPFLNLNASTVRNDLVYIPSTLYDNVFGSLQLKHWNSQGFFSVMAKRFIPDVRESIFAGTE